MSSHTFEFIHRVKATQWYRPGDHDSVLAAQAWVHWSSDRRSYYITEGKNRPCHWLAFDESAVQPADPFMGGSARFTSSRGQVYYRTVWPFSAWSIRSGDVELLEQDSSFYLDYLASMQGDWEPGHGEIPNYHKDHRFGGPYAALAVRPGDWVVQDGHKFDVLNDAAFHQQYEAPH